jgi:hypothetical protein
MARARRRAPGLLGVELGRHRGSYGELARAHMERVAVLRGRWPGELWSEEQRRGDEPGSGRLESSQGRALDSSKSAFYFIFPESECRLRLEKNCATLSRNLYYSQVMYFSRLDRLSRL